MGSQGLVERQPALPQRVGHLVRRREPSLSGVQQGVLRRQTCDHRTWEGGYVDPPTRGHTSEVVVLRPDRVVDVRIRRTGLVLGGIEIDLVPVSESVSSTDLRFG
jgi:hypothetical protein